MAQFKLTAKTVDAAKPGRYGDGAGLWLEVSKTGAKRWIYRFSREDGRVTEMGLGSVAEGVTLAKAREKAAAARLEKVSGKNPIKVKADTRTKKRSMPTFGTLADDYYAAHEKSWSNDKHRYQWKQSLTVYAAPIRSTPIDQLTVEQVLAVLRPIWEKIPETAERTRGRIARVFESVKPLGIIPRSAPNPAEWENNLNHLLPKKKELVRGHHPALHYNLIPEFMAALRDRDGISARALELCILCANRAGEILNAKWEEFDLDAALWTIPAARMKMREEHVIPLSESAVEIIKRMKEVRYSDFVFPSANAEKGLSNMSMTMMLRRMENELKDLKSGAVTTHGFRSTFRDWAGETTDFPEDLCERALAHTTGNKVKDAYQRMRAVERRRKLMAAWADYCGGKTKSDNVVQLRSA